MKLSKDPLFTEKVRDIVGLYLHPPGKALVLCVDAAVPARLGVHLILDNSSTHKTRLFHRWLLRHPRVRARHQTRLDPRQDAPVGRARPPALGRSAGVDGWRPDAGRVDELVEIVVPMRAPQPQPLPAPERPRGYSGGASSVCIAIRILLGWPSLPTSGHSSYL